MKFRFAERKDAAKILFFIKELAEYEKMSECVVATEAELEAQIFDKKNAEVIFALSDDGIEVGFALFFTTFSTFLAKPGIHLEDLYVLPEHRGRGFGRGLLCELAKTDKAKADAICDKVFKSFKEVEYDVNAFIENKKALLEALSE